jgi:hypothetical protein
MNYDDFPFCVCGEVRCICGDGGKHPSWSPAQAGFYVSGERQLFGRTSPYAAAPAERLNQCVASII